VSRSHRTGRRVGADDRDRGSVTAELAVALPAVVVLLVVVLVLATSVGTQLRCADAARTGARVAALGEGPGAVEAAATRVAGAGARVEVAHDGDWVTVTVSRAVTSGPLRAGSLRASAAAVAWAEP